MTLQYPYSTLCLHYFLLRLLQSFPTLPISASSSAKTTQKKLHEKQLRGRRQKPIWSQVFLSLDFPDSLVDSKSNRARSRTKSYDKRICPRKLFCRGKKNSQKIKLSRVGKLHRRGCGSGGDQVFFRK